MLNFLPIFDYNKIYEMVDLWWIYGGFEGCRVIALLKWEITAYSVEYHHLTKKAAKRIKLSSK